MSYGYSQSLVRANKAASVRHLGVALGRVCIGNGVGVSEVAEIFGVSRMTIYNWFKGTTHPNRIVAQRVQRYIETHRANQANKK